MNLKLLFLIIFALCCSVIQLTKAQCTLTIPRDKTIRPILFNNTTYYTSLVPNDKDWIYLEASEEITGFCNTGFERDPRDYKKSRIYCNGRTPQLRTPYDYYNLESETLKCNRVDETIIDLCIVNLSPLKLSKPKIFKNIGTQIVQMSSELKKFHLHNGQQATVRCETKFRTPMHMETELKLVCAGGNIVLLDKPLTESVYTYECETIQWNLYESKLTLPWCPSSMTSYILARPAANSYDDYEYLGGICYDLEMMSLKSLYYTDGPKSFKNLSPKILRTFKPSIEISEISDNFISKKTFSYDNPQIDNLLQYSNFKRASIVQNPSLSINMLEDLEILLQIDWWSSLRLGNWRFYEAALAKHIKVNSRQYDILAGTSGVIAAPIRIESCDKNFTMMALVDSENNKMPLYVWNYLKSVNNTGDDVVIIGVNSPFYDFYDENDLMFCKDICNQVPWLNNVYVTFRYKPMGVIFCCSVDEVILSQRLDGFTIPEESKPLPPIPSPIYQYVPIEMETTTVLQDTTMDVELFDTEREYDEYGNHY